MCTTVSAGLSYIPLALCALLLSINSLSAVDFNGRVFCMFMITSLLLSSFCRLRRPDGTEFHNGVLTRISSLRVRCISREVGSR